MTRQDVLLMFVAERAAAVAKAAAVAGRVGVGDPVRTDGHHLRERDELRRKVTELLAAYEKFAGVRGGGVDLDGPDAHALRGRIACAIKERLAAHDTVGRPAAAAPVPAPPTPAEPKHAAEPKPAAKPAGAADMTAADARLVAASAAHSGAAAVRYECGAWQRAARAAAEEGRFSCRESERVLPFRYAVKPVERAAALDRLRSLGFTVRQVSDEPSHEETELSWEPEPATPTEPQA